MVIGIQISSLEAYLNTLQAVNDTLCRLKEMGCLHVQLQWIAPSVPNAAVGDALRAHGLTSLGVQEKFDAGLSSLDRLIDLNECSGSTELCLSGIPERFQGVSGAQEFARALEHVRAQLGKEGQTLSYHPLWKDFRAGEDGLPMAEIVLEALPDLTLVPDTCQLIRAGLDAGAWIEAHAGHISMVHFKDMRSPDPASMLAPVGQGCTDFPRITAACLRAGVPYALVEQEVWDRDAFQCIREGFDYARRLLPRKTPF